MEFTYQFISFFAIGIKLSLPLLLTMFVFICGLGLVVGRREAWRRGDAVYWAFVTATTVGYGDYRPVQGPSRFFAILIALTGMILTGILVSIAVYAAQQSFTVVHSGVSMESIFQKMAN
jgi:voltage-gated potassium channel